MWIYLLVFHKAGEVNGQWDQCWIMLWRLHGFLSKKYWSLSKVEVELLWTAFSQAIKPSRTELEVYMYEKCLFISHLLALTCASKGWCWTFVKITFARYLFPTRCWIFSSPQEAGSRTASLKRSNQVRGLRHSRSVSFCPMRLGFKSTLPYHQLTWMLIFFFNLFISPISFWKMYTIHGMNQATTDIFMTSASSKEFSFPKFPPVTLKRCPFLCRMWSHVLSRVRLNACCCVESLKQPAVRHSVGSHDKDPNHLTALYWWHQQGLLFK